VGQLFIRRLAGLGDLVDLLADELESLPDVVVREGLDLGFELVDLVDQGLDASDLAVVRVDETGKESHGAGKYRVRPSGDRP
jgi:hypothetical protein